MTADAVDVAVIGAGLAGAAAAWRLAQSGATVAVLERTSPGNAEGSSHGSARIFRYAYPVRLYTDLVIRSRDGWDELERFAPAPIITPTGALDHGELRDPRALAEVLESAEVDHELLDPASAEQRWPQFRFDSEVLWHPGAGVLDAATAITTMLTAAQASGAARLEESWEVEQVSRTRTGFTLFSTAGQSIAARRIVVAAGGWLPALLHRLDLPARVLAAWPTLEVRQEQAFHMPYREASATPWPTFIHKTREGQTYGLPGGRDADFRGQKLAHFNGGPVIASAMDREAGIRAEARERIVSYAQEHIPGLVPETFAETSCLFTNTPTEDFLIDDVDGVVIVSACSGHGAKFAPLLGELAAEAVSGSGTVPAEFRLAHHARRAS